MNIQRESAVQSPWQGSRHQPYTRFVFAACLAINIAGCQQTKNDRTGPTLPSTGSNVASKSTGAVCLRPSEPLLPDGATASEAAMKGAQAELAPYVQSLNAYLHCLADQINQAKAGYDAFSANWKTQSDAYMRSKARTPPPSLAVRMNSALVVSPKDGVEAGITSSSVKAQTPPPSLTVHMNADGSLVVSQEDRAASAPITLPSIKALPAEIDALVPKTGERKKLAVSADPTGPWHNFVRLMNEAEKSGFDEISILGSEQERRGGPSELVIGLQHDARMPDPSIKPLFVSVGNDRAVILSLGMGVEATVMHVNLAGASEAAASLVPKGRPSKATYFRADVDAPIGNPFELLQELRAIGFDKFTIVWEVGEDD